MSMMAARPAWDSQIVRAILSLQQLTGKTATRFSKIPIGLIVAVLLLGALTAPALADVTYTFDHIVEPGDDANALASGAIGEAQLFVDVAAYDANQTIFTFRNTGPEACTITDVYFDDGALLRIASLVDADEGTGGDPNVDFSELAEPDDLPGGTLLSPPFITTEGFSADADPPPAQMGVDPNESLGIIFELVADKSYTDVLGDLASRELRIGIHVQNFDYGRSESFVNGPPGEQCSVTATAGPGGSIDPNGVIDVNCGQCITFEATPDSCRDVNTWYLDGNDLHINGPNYTLCVTGSHTLEVRFKEIGYTVTASAGECGSIDPNGVIDANCGDQVCFTASPDT
ncbi:MAG: InlB B-repeat-containing protein, partial [Planctomycetota bacterium]